MITYLYVDDTWVGSDQEADTKPEQDVGEPYLGEIRGADTGERERLGTLRPITHL